MLRALGRAARRGRPWALSLMAGVAIVAGLVGADRRLAAAEISALHLEFDKPVPMRRAEVVVYLSWRESAVGPDPGGESEELLACAVLPSGARGREPGTGELRVRLLGEQAGESWASRFVVRDLDARGEVGFEGAEIGALADEAPAGTALDLFEILWRGGRGKKIASVTIDCAVEVAR